MKIYRGSLPKKWNVILVVTQIGWGVVGKNLPLDLQMSTTDHAETWNRHWVLKSIATQPMACVASPACYGNLAISQRKFSKNFGGQFFPYLFWNYYCHCHTWSGICCVTWNLYQANGFMACCSGTGQLGCFGNLLRLNRANVVGRPDFGRKIKLFEAFEVSFA